MKIKIIEAEKLANKILNSLGFPEEEQQLITRNLLAAELSERKSHGIAGLLSISKFVNADHPSMTIKMGGEEISVIKETANSLYIDAKLKPGYYANYKSLEAAIAKTETSGIVSVGIKNSGYATGFIGDYARQAVTNDLIYIGFHSIYGDMFPHGAKKAIFGTNPLTVGVPSLTDPVILDMASSMSTIGNVVIAKREGKQIKEGVGMDSDGQPTTDPLKVLANGGVLPIAGHKGSGLAFIVELLGGVLTESAIGYTKKGAWGSFYILINPELFRPIKEFKTDVTKAIDELKNAPRANGFEEILFPGERSNKARHKNIAAGEFEIDDKIMNSLLQLG